MQKSSKTGEKTRFELAKQVLFTGSGGNYPNRIKASLSTRFELAKQNKGEIWRRRYIQAGDVEGLRNVL